MKTETTESRAGNRPSPASCSAADVDVSYMREYKTELIRHANGQVKRSGYPLQRKKWNRLIDDAIEAAAKSGDVIFLNVIIQPRFLPQPNEELTHDHRIK